MVAQSGVCKAPLEVGIGILGFKLCCKLEGCQGCLVVAQSGVCKAPLEVGIGAFGTDLNRLVKGIDCRSVISPVRQGQGPSGSGHRGFWD